MSAARMSDQPFAPGDPGTDAIDLERLTPEALGPLPEGGRQAAWWTRRANLENFLHTLGHMAAGEQSPTLAALAAGVRATLQKLP